MAHHSSDGPFLDEEQSEMAREFKRKLMMQEHLQNALGPTGEFPQGKLVPHDEGELQFAVGVVKGKIVMEFGKPVKSIGMDRHQARLLAEMLIAKSEQALLIGERQEKTSITVTE